MMINDDSEEKFSVIATPRPSPIEAGNPTHTVRIVVGEHDGAYFTGTYEQCTEEFTIFMEGYELYLSNFTNQIA